MNSIYYRFKRSLTKFLVITILLQFEIQCSQECPKIQTYQNSFNNIKKDPRTDLDYYVLNFLRIPETNLLIVNTITSYQDQSIAYYNDLSSTSGEIINVIKPDYVIINLDYITSWKKLLISNYEKIIIADPYTLKSVASLSISQIQHTFMIPNTNYAVITLFYNAILILDAVEVQIVQTLDHSGDSKVVDQYQYYSYAFQFSFQSQVVIMISNIKNINAYSIDINTLQSTYNGVVDKSNHAMKNSYRRISKHQTEDIIFLGGASYEIIALKIKSLSLGSGVYKQMMSLKLYNGYYSTYVYNIVYTDSNSESNQPTLYIGDNSYIYTLPLNIDLSNEVITASTFNDPAYKENSCEGYWLQQQESKSIIMVSTYWITVFNYKLNTYSFNLFFKTDRITRKILFKAQSKELLAMYHNQYYYFSERTNLGDYYYYNNNTKFKYAAYPYANNLQSVKNSTNQYRVTLKTRDSTKSIDYISIANVYPFDEVDKYQTINTTSLKLNWDLVNQNIDSFQYNAKTWILVGFPNKTRLSIQPNCLFYMINAQNTAEYFPLISSNSTNNSKNTNFAISSQDDPTNLEIVGVDVAGTIYIWDLASRSLKNQFYLSFCQSSVIGEILHYRNSKKLILVCNNLNTYSVDLQTGKEQFLKRLTSIPVAIKSSTALSIIAIGDKQSGYIYTYKYNQNTNLLDTFLTIKPGSLADNVQYIDFLDDNSLYVQYSNNILFYAIQECIQNPELCTQCNQNYYFKTTNQHDIKGIFGSGTQSEPYYTSDNFFTAMIKAQYYQSIIGGITNMNVNINIYPQNTMRLTKELVNFDFNSIISLSFQSTDETVQSTIQYYQQFSFQNYNSIIFKNIKINYQMDSSNNLCGLSFKNIKNNIYLDNISQFPLDPSSVYRCQSIVVDNSNLYLSNYVINDEDFSEHQSIISTINTNYVITQQLFLLFINIFCQKQIELQQLTIQNCKLGDKFSILAQETNVSVNIKTLKLIDNQCKDNLTEDSLPQSLFTAGKFAIDDAKIIGNQFCNKNIFQTITSLKHINQKFELTNIDVFNNEFQVRTNFILFSVLYSILSKPSHELILSSVYFENNKLNQFFPADLPVSSFIQTNKIAKITLTDVKLENHFNIQASIIEYSNLVKVNQLSCINDDAYLAQIPDEETIGCIQLNEVNQVDIYDINVIKKKSYDNTLVTIENYIVQSAIINIQKGQFNNIVLVQSVMNSFATPIYIGSSYQITLNIIDCHFDNNKLDSIQHTLTYSTTGLWIENYVGSVLIKESSFNNCYSNSKYNFMYIQSKELEFDTVQLNKSSFTYINDANKDLPMFLQQGGMMNLVVNQLKILSSSFSQATANKGAFIYLKSFGTDIQIKISGTSFSEGYAQTDGGAFYIDPAGASINLQCEKCQFSNIYSFMGNSTIISLQQSIAYGEQLDIVNFTGGLIKNVYGVKDNYFITVYNTQLNLNIPKILSEDFSSNSVAHSLFLQNTEKQQSTLMNLQNSIAKITNCQIFNLNFNNQNAHNPLLIYSQQSVITIKNSQFKDSTFISSAIQLNGGKLYIDNSQFSNINQLYQQRFLQLISEVEPQENGSSLIIVLNGDILASNKSKFEEINCSNNCNGGVFQLKNGSIDLDDVFISGAQSTFGGGIYISGITGQSSISNSEINNCSAKYDGGAIFLQALNTDKFKLVIGNSQLTSNQAIEGKGGALYLFSPILNSSEQSIQINDSKISDNRAIIGGGIEQKNISPLKQNTIIQNNVGELFGNDQISYPSKLKLLSLSQFSSYYKPTYGSDFIEIDSFRSGDILKYLSFQLLNDKNEVIIPVTLSEKETYNVYYKISSNTQNPSNYDIRGDLQTFYKQDTNSFTFGDLAVVGAPGSSVVIEFKSDQIYILNQQTNQYEQNYSFKIKINFRMCMSGEQQIKYNDLTECQICEAGMYSYNVKLCQDCPQGATCKGGANLITNAGYWRKTNESEIILNCENLEDNCIGGQFGDTICYEGHIGALCEECDIYGDYWGASYSKSAKYSCARCDQIKNNIWIVILTTIWTQISMTLAIKGGVDDIKNKAAAFVLRRNLIRNKSSTYQQPEKRLSINNIRSYAKSQTLKNSKIQQDLNIFEKDNSGIFIKMFTNYMQIVGSIATFNLTIPSGIFELPESIGQPLKQTMNSLDCALQQINTEMPIIYLRLVFSVIFPLFYLLLFFIILTIYHLVKKDSKFEWYILSTAAMFLIIYIQPDLVAQIIALLSCRKIGDTSYILSNVAFECYTDEHKQYVLFLIVPLLLVWVFILPFILFMLLRKNKDQLGTIKIKLKYGFLYKEYKDRAFYWEFIKMAEKIAIILSLNFYSQSIIIKGILVFIVITFYGILSLIIEPYQDKDVNQVDINSTNVCAITVLLGIFIYNNPYTYFVYSSLALIIIINLLFIIKLLQQIVGAYIPKMQTSITLALEVLSKKISCLSKYVKKQEEKKKMKNQIAQKFRRIFQNYLDMPPHEKKKFILKMIEYQISKTHKHLFQENEEKLLNSVQRFDLQQKQKRFDDEKILDQQDQRQQLNEDKLVKIDVIQFYKKQISSPTFKSNPVIVFEDQEEIQQHSQIEKDEQVNANTLNQQSPKKDNNFIDDELIKLSFDSIEGNHE